MPLEQQMEERFEKFKKKCTCRSTKDSCSECPSTQEYLAFIHQERQLAKKEVLEDTSPCCGEKVSLVCIGCMHRINNITLE